MHHSGEQYAAAAAAKLLQSRPTLCDPIDGSPPGSSAHGILQAGRLEWVPLPSPPGSAGGKETACQCRRYKRCGFDPWVGKITLVRI